MNEKKIIGIAYDHAGEEYKEDIKKYLEEKGYKLLDLSKSKKGEKDYPIEADKLCQSLIRKDCDLGIALCGAGTGMAIACNRFRKIRACCCTEPSIAYAARRDNDANVLCLGARVITLAKTIEIIDAFLKTDFSNEERHKRRIAILS